MKLKIYKGFDVAFLEELDTRPLVEGDIVSKIDVLSFDKPLLPDNLSEFFIWIISNRW